MKAAQIILAQLGGSRFMAMTGARDFVGSADCLTFSLPAAAKGINKVQVKLVTDLYTVAFYKLRGVSLKPIAIINGVGCDQLQAVFSANTGLDCHL
jgi:hypothetical protein